MASPNDIGPASPSAQSSHRSPRIPGSFSSPTLTLFQASPSFAMDQLSSLARKAPSLSALSAAVFNNQPLDEAERRQQIETSVQQATTGMITTAKLAFNDCSLGLYQVADHIQRKVPILVEDKKKLQGLRRCVTTADSDLEDARRMVGEIEQLESFHQISTMLRASLDIARSIKK
ncbi:hypothetical protein BX666DRAFT_604527 [Dichotomocladium elegans]|nr:hypothetical protein BX666DRAFT_604527 [Dichotomocladium elegans]